jgi:tRNA 2-thiouridine synthesizing protein A
MSTSADAQLDARGLYCPEPVMLLHNVVRDMAVGELLEVLATDPSTQRDIPRFCRFLGHELVAEEQDGDEFRYLIRKLAS